MTEPIFAASRLDVGEYGWWRGRVQAWRDTRAVAAFAKDRGAKLGFRSYFRDRLACLREGHVESRQVRRFSARDQKTALDTQLECPRCGERLGEVRKVAQFPRPANQEAWIR